MYKVCGNKSPYNESLLLISNPHRRTRQLVVWGVHTGLSKKNGIVLGAPAKNLDCPPDLVIAPNHRVKLPVSGGLCQVPAVLFERLFQKSKHMTKKSSVLATRTPMYGVPTSNSTPIKIGCHRRQMKSY